MGMAVFEQNFDKSRDRLALASIYRPLLQKPSTCASLARPKEGSYLLKKTIKASAWPPRVSNGKKVNKHNM